MIKDIVIRKAVVEDETAIWSIIRAVITTGDTYVFAPDTTKEDMLRYWCGADMHTYVATLYDRIVGTFIIKENFTGLGSHIATASYMTDPTEFGKGIGKTMGVFSIKEARQMGYSAMQFNLVVKTNERAVKLWQHLGFNIIGEIPEAFQHQTLGLVNAYIMWRNL